MNRWSIVPLTLVARSSLTGELCDDALGRRSRRRHAAAGRGGSRKNGLQILGVNVMNLNVHGFTGWLAITAMVAFNPVVIGQPPIRSLLNGNAAESPVSFTGEKTSWHGFDRFDFLMDAAALTVKPIKAF